MSVRPIVSTRLALNRYMRNLTAYWGRLEKSVDKFQVWLKSANNIGDFTWMPKLAYSVDRGTKYSAAGQQGRANALSRFHGNSGYANASQCYVIRRQPILSNLVWRTVYQSAAAKLRNTTIKFVVCLSVRPSVRPQGTIRLLHWWDFPWYFRTSWKCRKIQVSLKSDNNNWYLYTRHVHVWYYLPKLFVEWESSRQKLYTKSKHTFCFQ